MANVEKLILQLENNNPNKRYEACEELRVAEEVPDEAISALQKTTNDSNELVADAARRALAMHVPPDITGDQPENNDAEKPFEEQQSQIIGPVIFSAGAAFVSSMIFLWNSEGAEEMFTFVPIAPIILCFYSIGASLIAMLIAFAIASILGNRLKIIYALSLVIAVLIGFLAGYFMN